MTVATGAPTTGAPAPPRAARIEAMVFVGFVIALGIATIVLTGNIREPQASLTLSPRIIPYVVGGLITVAGVAVLIGQLRGHFGTAEEGEDIDNDHGTSWITVGIITLAFVSLMITIPMLGWPLAVTILFGGAATALGAKTWWVAVLVGLALGVATQIVFGSLLGLSLPITGDLTTWIPLG